MSYGPTLLVGHDATGLCWLVYNLHRPVHLSPQVRLWLPTASHRRHFHQGFPALMFGDCFLRGPGPTTSEGMHAQDRENPGLPTEARGGMVEMGGIEPPSNGRPRILLRAQSTVLFLSPQHCVDTPPDRLS